MVNVCGKVVGEKQEYSNQLYERCVVRKAGVIMDDSNMNLLNIISFFHLGDNFTHDEKASLQM